MNNSKLRTFLAIDIDKKLIQKIEDLQKEFEKTNANIKYVEIENIHFTLKFFGNINEEMVDKISISTENVLKKYEPIDITIEGTGSFPSEDFIKVIWLGITENQVVMDLAKKLDEEFKKIGFKKEKNYSPHLTIGRMRSPKNKKEVKEKIATFKDIKIGKMSIDKISLKKSELTPKGPIYSDLKTFSI
ncbi:MAG: RNA 2',3'-cyclic phosphodiesterase [Methanobacteriaceae archaeon]|jgi:2'-5' RNA ligase|nr:RNA 2',3'-cyclic phosphodiesterase [Candidatus Methanorudis spinitermitis]